MRRVVAFGILVALVLLGAGAVVRSPLFALRSLVVRGTGASRVTAHVLALSSRTSLLLVSPRALAARALAADPLAARAEVTVALPHTLRITLVPRRAVCLIPAGSPTAPDSVEGMYGMDPSGRVLPADRAELTRLPVVTGLAAAPIQPFGTLGGPSVDTALAVVRALPAGLVGDVSEIHVEAQGAAAELILMDAQPVLLGPPTDLAAKLAALPVLLRRYPWPEYAGTGFDLRDPGRPSLFTVGRS